MVTTAFNTTLKPATLALAVSLAWSLPAASQESSPWQRCNRADVKALKVFTVGEAALYRQNCDAADLLAPPLKLSFRYFREVPGDAFGKAAMHFLEKNLPASQFTRLEPELKSFNQHYQDVDDGDRYVLVYEDGGLTLTLNGQALAEQQGDDFARAYLTIWFGQDPYSETMKETLLGQR
ncbi:chalcone isomerase family protein [Alcanivorax sediminis]|uniref:Chalcone isomerase domain-containing protein n=1 Tax=Alcanivorax sediminis TaxID=2663008 RepID=A0A6N7LSH3_9GAMM|nr:chalcone isomerase family protein [Alcanivorax sediminis]MQX53378.1 hypothetical protein [Alcanivorax sediminis]